MGSDSDKIKIEQEGVLRETLIKAFPVPDLRCEAAPSYANPCISAGGAKETLNKAVFP